MTNCYRCGDDDHLSYDCPNTTPRRAAPPAPWPAAGAEQGKERPHPPPFASLYQRPEEERADPRPWADSIRQAMGWSRDHADNRLRELAARQAEASRRDRFGTFLVQ